MEYIIRNAQGVDLASVNNIYNQAVQLVAATADLEPISISQRKLWFEEHQKQGNPILVTELDGQVVGWLSFSFYRDGRMAVKHVREISYYIHEDYRGKGVASHLIEMALQTASEAGIDVLITFIIDGNTGSIRLMEKFDFELWGRMSGIVRVKQGDIRDHLIYGLKCN